VVGPKKREPARRATIFALVTLSPAYKRTWRLPVRITAVGDQENRGAITRSGDSRLRNKLFSVPGQRFVRILSYAPFIAASINDNQRN
jgi:hypothetical protein